MPNKQQNIIFTIASQLIVLGCTFGILFGQGTHLHDIAFHIGDHLDVHASVHAHSTEEGHHADHHSQEKKDEEHGHEIQIFDVSGILVSPVKVFVDTQAQTIPHLFAKTEARFWQFAECLFLFDLPPPDKLVQQYHSLSYSLRGPPIV